LEGPIRKQDLNDFRRGLASQLIKVSSREVNARMQDVNQVMGHPASLLLSNLPMSPKTTSPFQDWSGICV
jgi:hypothetical protein